MPENTKKVCRPSLWGNPFRIGYRSFVRGKPVIVQTREQAVALFREWLTTDPAAEHLRRFLPNLRGKNLGCFCRLDQPCHADVLLELANKKVEAPK